MLTVAGKAMDVLPIEGFATHFVENMFWSWNQSGNVQHTGTSSKLRFPCAFEGGIVHHWVVVATVIADFRFLCGSRLPRFLPP